MDVFLTWSGLQSHAVAMALREWIPLILQRVKPFLSSEDIRKGSRWNQEIAQKLASTKYAIVCLTADNVGSKWIHFEAGAVSKELQAAKVTSLLIGIEPSNVSGPLTQFQNTGTTREEMLKLMRELNKEFGSEQLSDEQVTQTFTRFWPDLEQKIAAALVTVAPAAKTARSQGEVLEELLEISRANGRSLSSLLTLEERLIAAAGRSLLAPLQQRGSLGGLGSGAQVPPPVGLYDLGAAVSDTPLPLLASTGDKIGKRLSAEEFNELLTAIREFKFMPLQSTTDVKPKGCTVQSKPPGGKR